MFEQAFGNIDDVLHEKQVARPSLATQQTPWLLFQKYLDDFDHDKRTEAAFERLIIESRVAPA